MQSNEWLKSGDRVRITDGPYKGRVVTVVKMASESPAAHIITDLGVNHWIDLDDLELA
jgi:ribosomal protein L24